MDAMKLPFAASGKLTIWARAIGARHSMSAHFSLRHDCSSNKYEYIHQVLLQNRIGVWRRCAGECAGSNRDLHWTVILNISAQSRGANICGLRKSIHVVGDPVTHFSDWPTKKVVAPAFHADKGCKRARVVSRHVCKRLPFLLVISR